MFALSVKTTPKALRDQVFSFAKRFDLSLKKKLAFLHNLILISEAVNPFRLRYSRENELWVALKRAFVLNF